MYGSNHACAICLTVEVIIIIILKEAAWNTLFYKLCNHMKKLNQIKEKLVLVRFESNFSMRGVCNF